MFENVNAAQILLTGMVLLLGVTLIVIGIQLFFVLKDLRRSLAKTDVILNDVQKISAKAVHEQEYVDDILLTVKNAAASLTHMTTSTGKLLSPTTVGVSLIQAFGSVMSRRRTREERDG